MTNRPASFLITSSRLVFLLAGCVSPSMPAQVAPDLSNVWGSLLPHRGATSALCELWREFSDPKLTSQIERALAKNSNLQVAAAKRRQAQAWFRLYRRQGGG